MNRREAISTLSAVSVSAISAACLTNSLVATEAPSPKKSGLGLVIYCCKLQRESQRSKDPKSNLYAPGSFLQHCKKVGAGGMQASLGVMTEEEAKRLRKELEDSNLYLEAIVSPPKEKKEVERFNAEMKTAVEAGALAARTTIIPGRRYEFFDSLEKFQEFDKRGRKSLELAAPIAEKHKLPLAIENHKDHRDDERIALFEHISSEYVGACLDTGNSFALMEDTIETAKKFAKWTHSVHLKDQAVQLYSDGFLLGDIPLGQGFIDLKQIVEIVRKEKPKMRFSLELITRDPLKVPCLEEKYWATFPELPAKEMARTLKQVRDSATNNLQYVTKLSKPEQVALETSNVRASLDYARDHLGLTFPA